MSLWDSKECVSLFWNSAGVVSGVLVIRRSKGFELSRISLSHCEESGGGAVAMVSLGSVLMTSSVDIVIVGGDFDGSVCFDMSIPVMPDSDIRQAVQYELSRHVPCETGDIVFGYRVLKPESSGVANVKLLIRVFASTRKAWSELLTDFTTAGVRFDAFAHPYMVIDPLLAEVEEIFFPGVDREFKYSKVGVGGGRQMRSVEMASALDYGACMDYAVAMGYDKSIVSKNVAQEELEIFLPAMMQAAFALSPDFQKNKRNLFPLPPELRSERFKRLRFIFIAMLLLVLSLSCVLISINWWDDWSAQDSLLRENAVVKRRIIALRTENAKLELFENNVVRKLADANPGNRRILHCLYALSRLIPKNAYLLNFSSRGDSLDVSLKASKGQRSEIMKALNASKLLKVTNSNTQRRSDGSESIYIHLEMVKNVSSNDAGGGIDDDK